MCTRVMTEELTHARFETDQIFVEPSCTINDGAYDLERFRSLADRIKPFLGPCLEKRIHSGLEEFVCKSSSRYSKRFPRVKRCLDAVAAWLNYLDAFRAKDIEEEAIKHAIEYLLKDGRVTHLEDPVVPNAGINRVDLDSLTEQNAIKNRNVWSFIKEKDYWLCQDREQATRKPSSTINSQIQECKRENGSSDLDVEIGSIKREIPTKVTCNKIETKDRCDREIISCSKQHNENCDENLRGKSSKLKLVIHKTTSTNCCTLRKSPKVSSLSVPCKSSHLIVRLFEADPSLSDSCLILMKRKFQHDIRNACSCLNDIFKKVDDSTMKRLCLNCKIRPGRIDLNLHRDDGSSKVRLFLARVPICLNVHKRESSCGNTRSEESQGSSKNLDYCCRQEFQERQIAFYSQCSDHDLMEKKGSPKDVTGKEVNFVWSKKGTKEVDFVLSSSFTRSRADEDLEENFVPKGDSEKNNSSITGDDDRRKLDDTCISSSGGSIGQDNSTIGGCDPDQCSCHVLCTNNDNSELENSMKEEKCVTRSENVIDKKDRSEEDDSKTKIDDLRVQDFSKLERNIVTVRSSTLRVQKVSITTEISETKKNSETKETRSIDYISSTVSKNNSKISKCSRCGKDLSEEGSKNIPKSFDTETRRTCSVKTTCRTFVMRNNKNLSTACPGNCKKNLINNEIPESCKYPSNSSARTNMDTRNFSEKNFHSKSTEFRSKFSNKPCRSSSTSKTGCRAQEDSSYLPSRRRNSFWKRSIVPGSFCGSFPALDRIKYLIRKKLRRLLLEERDKGTSTSKTYLKNDRYLVSISSGKLNEEGISSSIRCPFTTRNRAENRCPRTTFSEGSSLTKKKKDTFEEIGVKDRCRRMIQDNEVFRKIRLGEISRFLGQKSGSMMDNQKMIDEKEQCPFYRDGKRRGRSSMESFLDDLDETRRKNGRKFSRGILKEGINSPNIIPRKNCHRRGREGGDAIRDERPRHFEKRFFKYCKIEDYDDDNDFMNLLGSYERRISDLDADFRLKLLQYVALCRSVKDLLMKRLPPADDVYEGSSSSM